MKRNHDINRSAKTGAPLYCGRVCFGLAHRDNKTIEQRKAEKAIYDTEYRADNLAMLKDKKKEYFKRTYDVGAAKIERARLLIDNPERERKRREYMASPEYRAEKKKYDQEFRARKKYGDYWECAILTININQEVKSRASDIEIRTQNGTLNKVKTRKRDYEKSICNKLERVPLGNLECNKR